MFSHLNIYFLGLYVQSIWQITRWFLWGEKTSKPNSMLNFLSKNTGTFKILCNVITVKFLQGLRKCKLYLNSKIYLKSKDSMIFPWQRQRYYPAMRTCLPEFSFNVSVTKKNYDIYHVAVTKKNIVINFFRHFLICFHTNLDLYHWLSTEYYSRNVVFQ